MLIIITNYFSLSLEVYVFKNLFKRKFHSSHTFTFTLFQLFSAFTFKTSSFSSQISCVNMASSSVPNTSTQRTESMEQYKEPFRTLLTPIDNLEVLSELIVDFESLQENGFNLSE